MSCGPPRVPAAQPHGVMLAGRWAPPIGPVTASRPEPLDGERRPLGRRSLILPVEATTRCCTPTSRRAPPNFSTMVPVPVLVTGAGTRRRSSVPGGARPCENRPGLECAAHRPPGAQVDEKAPLQSDTATRRTPGTGRTLAGDGPPPSGRRPGGGCWPCPVVGRAARATCPRARGSGLSSITALGAQRDASAERRAHPQRVSPTETDAPTEEPSTTPNRGTHPSQSRRLLQPSPHAEPRSWPNRHADGGGHRDPDAHPSDTSTQDRQRTRRGPASPRGCGGCLPWQSSRRGAAAVPRPALASPLGVGGRPSRRPTARSRGSRASLLPQLQLAGTADALAGGWRVAALRVAALEDRLNRPRDGGPRRGVGRSGTTAAGIIVQARVRERCRGPPARGHDVSSGPLGSVRGAARGVAAAAGRRRLTRADLHRRACSGIL